MRLPAIIAAAILATAGAIAVSCSTVQQVADSVNLYSPQEENKMGLDAYQQVLKDEKKSTDAEGIALVQRVGKRLAAVVPGGDQFQWEFTLLESDTVNAFCLPGGKVAIYTGILPYCQNEAALAAVMGHEIGHAVARHGGKRMTQGVILGGAQMALGEVLKAKGYTENTTTLALAAAGGLAQVGVVLPFSRGHESEADAMGLEYMAKAGYDPQEASQFWLRFAKLGSSGPAFLSTHPQSADRAADLSKQLPQAQQWYAGVSAKSGLGAQVPAKYREVKPPAPAAK